MKLKTLRPRLATIPGRLQMAASLQTDRLRGRAAVNRRARFLELHPLCCMCEVENPPRVTAATVPDHIVAIVNGGPDTEDNLQSLCEEHHRIKTAKDLGHMVKPTIGVDGWPET